MNVTVDIQEAYALSCRLLGIGFPISRVGRLISKNARVHLDVRACVIFLRCPDGGPQKAVAILNMAEEHSAKARSLPAAKSLSFVSVYRLLFPSIHTFHLDL